MPFRPQPKFTFYAPLYRAPTSDDAPTYCERPHMIVKLLAQHDDRTATCGGRPSARKLDQLAQLSDAFRRLDAAPNSDE